VRRVPGVTWRWFRGDVLVLSSDGGRVRVGGAGALVWTVLDEPVEVGEIGPKVEARWPTVGPATPATVSHAIEVLKSSGLVTVEEA